MRDSVIKEIKKLAIHDNRVYLLTGDLGYVVLDEFRNTCPDRYINVGIAEQNMASIAAGMSHEGNMVFIYSIGNFPTLRCMEQIRNDICFHKSNVKILAVGGGFSYGNQGISHHATEDIAMMRVLPNMHVYVPGDPVEAVYCLRDAYAYDGPCYIRLSRGNDNRFHKDDPVEGICKISEDGADIAIFTSGTIVSEGLRLQKMLNVKTTKRAVLFSVPKVKPIDKQKIIEVALNAKLVVTMEEHQISGGLGGIFAEIFSEIQGKHALLYRAGLNDVFSEVVGNQDYLRDYYGISADKLLPVIEKIIGEID